MPSHRVAIRDALIALFENPVPDNNTVCRTVLTLVLGLSPIDFGKPILNFKENEHLSALCKPERSPVVWEGHELFSNLPFQEHDHLWPFGSSFPCHQIN